MLCSTTLSSEPQGTARRHNRPAARQDAGQAPVAVLERVDFQEDHDEDGDGEERVEIAPSRLARVWAISSVIRRGVSKGDAVWKITPGFSPAGPNAST